MAKWGSTGLGLLLLALYLTSGFALPGGADVRRHSSGILDMDVSRVVADVATPGRAYRASVHPLQKLLVAPFGVTLASVLGEGRRLEAVKLLIALVTLWNALACGALARRLAGGSATAGLAAGLLCGVSFASILAASIPESAVFAGLAGIAPLWWLARRWEEPPDAREALVWGALAIPAFGLTLTQVGPWAIALGVRLAVSPGARAGLPRPTLAAVAAAAAGLGVLLALGLQALVFPEAGGAWRPSELASESAYLRDASLRADPLGHGLRLLRHFAVLDFVAPRPGYSEFLLRAGFDYWSLSVESVPLASWPAAQLALAATLLVSLLAAAALAPRRDARLLAPLLCVGFHLLLHALYGREYVIHAPHWHATLVALLVAGAWNGLVARGGPGPRARGLFVGWVAALSLLLTANNLWVMRQLYAEVAFGLDAGLRDARGERRSDATTPPAPGRSRSSPARGSSAGSPSGGARG